MRLRASQTHITLAATTAIFAILFAAASIHYSSPPFFTLYNFLTFFSDMNAVIGIAAIGMTFVILSGGIDLSVGAVAALSTVLAALLVEQGHVHPAAAAAIVLAAGAAFGCLMGCVIHFFELAPFLITLAGMFLARGIALTVNPFSTVITHPLITQQAAAVSIRFEVGTEVRIPALIFLGALAIAVYLGSYTRFGRNVYAIGGSESSAALMGLPVGATKVAVYTLSGFCSALAGIASVLYMPSGNANTAIGMELDVIAAVVIGGTLLSGGVGHVFGTLIGVLILGLIQAAIIYQGNLSSWWAKIAIGVLLFVFVVLQRFLAARFRAKRR